MLRFHFPFGYVVFVCGEYCVCYYFVECVYIVCWLNVVEYVFYFLCKVFPECFPVVCVGAEWLVGVKCAFSVVGD